MDGHHRNTVIIVFICYNNINWGSKMDLFARFISDLLIDVNCFSTNRSKSAFFYPQVGKKSYAYTYSLLCGPSLNIICIKTKNKKKLIVKKYIY